jgi:enamine deaminase RidA (YjgF/YER057c/UK114 family)
MAEQYKKEVLLADERNRGFAAVAKYGPFLFVSGSDGHRDLETEQIVPELSGKAIEQCRNSYGRIDERLRKCGYGGDCAVWIENFTSGQEWRLPRMALWPEYFGQEEHGLAVSFGAQTRMSGLNMITTTIVAVTPDVKRTAVVPQPTPGRASRCTVAEPFVFVIGVRGHEDPFTNDVAPEETRGSFEAQLHNSYQWLKSHTGKAGASVQDFVRVDACIRDVNRAPDYRRIVQDYMGGKIPFASYTIGVPLGSRLEQEIGGIAVAPGTAKEVAWDEQRPSEAQATRAGGLVFASGCSGLQDAKTGGIVRDLYGDKAGQTKQAMRRLEAGLGRFGVGLDKLLRLDVYVRDIYFEEEIVAIARDMMGQDAGTITILGGEPEHSGEIEVSGIAAAA